MKSNLWPDAQRVIADRAEQYDRLGDRHPVGYRDSGQQQAFRPRDRLSPQVMAGVVKLVDFCLVLMAAAIAFTLYFSVVQHSAGEEDRDALTSILAAILFVGGFQRIGGYKTKYLSRLSWQTTRAVSVWAMVVSAMLILAFLGKVSESYSRGWVFAWFFSTLALVLFHRVVVQVVMTRWMRKGYFTRNVVIVGAGEQGERLIAKLTESGDKGIAIRGVFDDRKFSRVPRSVSRYSVLGNTDDLVHFARQTPVDDVIIALPLNAAGRLKSLIDKLKLLPVDVGVSAEPMAGEFPVLSMCHLSNVPVIEVLHRPITHFNAVAKFLEDRLLGALLLLFSIPSMAIIALLIKLDSPGPVFFVQERFGFNNRIIRVLKFRTMYADFSDRSGAQRTVYNDPRVTRVGRVLRALSLDELPQLINVLRGDMSLVGPRPHAIAMKVGDLPYSDAIRDYLPRHRVKPGMTGWAQVNGFRGEVDTLEKARARIEHDLYYIDHWSLWLDLKIIVMTVVILLSRENAY